MPRIQSLAVCAPSDVQSAEDCCEDEVSAVLENESYFDNDIGSEDLLAWAQSHIIDVPLGERQTLKTNTSGLPNEQRELAEKWAMTADTRYRACAALRPGSGGIRIGVKDTVDVAGFPTGLGLRRYRHYPEKTTPLLRPMASHICAKLVTTELNVGVGSGCNNPYFPEVDPAGSSTGCGVAVAAGIVDIGFGTDVLGSIRWPAGRCGVVGLRTTHGASSISGIFPLSPSMDTPGWVARSGDDLAFTWERFSLGRVVRGRKLRIGVLSEAREACQDTEILEALERTVRALETSGHTVADESVGDIWDWRAAAWEMCGRDLWLGYLGWNKQLNDDLSDTTTASIAVGEAVCEERYQKIAEKQQELRKSDLFGATDAWLLPLDPALPRKRGTYAAPASTIPSASSGEDERRIGYTPLASFAGLPAITFPVGEVSGIPLAMQLVGRPARDADLISLAQDVNDALGRWKGTLK